MKVDARFVTWCTACQWNAEPHPEPKRKFVARLAARQADWLARRLYADISSHSRDKRRGLAVLSTAYLLASIVHLMTVALIVAGVAALVQWHGIVWPIRYGAAAFLLGLAWTVQPFRRRRKRRTTPRLDPASAPCLFGLIDEVAAAIGAPSVKDVVVRPDYNASYLRLGRGKSAVSIGMALWAVLEPQERVALLGHELGHSTNGDLREMRFFDATLGSVRRWRLVLLPTPSPVGRRAGAGIQGLVAFMEQFVVPIVLLPLSAVIGTIGNTLHLLAQRQGQRCEYYADELAARAGGSDAAIGLADKLLVADACWRVVIQTLKFGKGADPWRAVRDFALSIPPSEWDRRRLLGRRRLNRIDTSHPPSIFRADLLRSRPPRPAAIILPAERSATIDAELATVRKEVLTS